MATVDFNEIFSTIKEGIVSLAKTTVSDYAEQAIEAGHQALLDVKGDLERWTQQVADGELSAEDLRFLVAGRKELIEMRALQQTGIAKIHLDKFKNGVIDLVIGTITSVI